VEIRTPGAHAAYTHLSANAIRIATRIIDELYGLEGLKAGENAVLSERLARSTPIIDRDLGNGASAILDCVTVSVGVIEGGVKINVLPGRCRFEADIRLPVGMTHADMLSRVEGIIAGYPEATLTPIWTHSSEPTLSDPDHEMIGIVKATVADLGRPAPVESISLGATDCKHFRRAGTPSYVYGCAPNGMAKPDEWVDVEEFLHIVRTHVLASATYLTS
jgi:succinyl-diaminopimelate desuccinylase